MQPTPSDLLSLISSHLRPGPLSGLLFLHSHRKLPCFYLLSRMFHVPHSSHLHCLYHHYNTEEAKSMQILITQFSPSRSSAPFPNTLQVCSLRKVSQSHNTNSKLEILLMLQKEQVFRVSDEWLIALQEQC